MSDPPEYKQALVCPSAPTNQDPQQYPPYPTSSQYQQYPAAAAPSSQYPPYPAQSSQYPPYAAAPSSQYPAYPAPESSPSMQPYATNTGYAQTPYYPSGPAQEPSANQNEVQSEGIGFNTDAFSDKKLRHQFIKKVYLILMCQLLFTFGVVSLFYFSKSTKNWVQRNPWCYWMSYAIFLVTYITLVCCSGVRRRFPGNFICLSIFTAAFSYMVGTITSFYDTQSVMIAVGITAAVCLAVSIFAIQTKIDFTMCSGLIFAFCMVFILFGFACLITYLISGPNYILECVYGGLAAGLFSLFLIFDTQMVVGGKNRRYELSPEEYIYGALQLYVDVVNLFIIILGLVGGKR